MFCKYCGAEISNDAVFCPKCGQQVAAKDSSTGNTNHPVDNAETYNGGEAGQPQSSPAMRADSRVTGVGKSALMLAFTICLSAELLFSLLGFSISVLTLLGLIIDVIVCVGCWMVYANSSQNRAPVAGFSVLRVGVPLHMAIMLIGAIVSIVFAARWYYGWGKASSIIGYLVEIVLVCWCFYGLCRVTNDGRKILNGEADAWQVTTSCFVIFIILAVLEVIYTIVSLPYLLNVAAIISYLATAVVWILAVAILFVIRKQK